MNYHIHGDVHFTNPAVAGPAPIPALAAGVNAAALFDSDVNADVKLPAIVNLSYFETLNDRWDLMLDAQWTQWSTIRTLSFVRANGALLQSTPENFRNTWKLAVGANYRYNSEWMWRGGLAYDQSPVQTADRTPRLPDANRTWFAGGVEHRWSPQVKLDAGAACAAPTRRLPTAAALRAAPPTARSTEVTAAARGSCRRR
jgi:long-chain fatty acid transport protein